MNNGNACSWEVSRVLLGVERHRGGIVASPIVDQNQLSGLHGFYGGAYRSDYSYITLSSMSRGGGIPVVYEAPNRVLPQVEHRSGTALYAGAMFSHYGHFLIESTSRLWATQMEHFDHIVFQAPQGSPENLLEYQRTLLGELGLLDRHVLVTPDHQGLSFDELLVVEPSYEIGRRITKEFARTFDPLRTKASAHRSVYVSRLNLSYGTVVGERIVQALFEHLGFEIFCPEQHTLVEQIALYQTTRRLAGIIGSAMHNILLMPYGTEVINVIRSPDATSSSFYLIDNAMNANVTYIDGVDHAALRTHPDRGPTGPFILDISKIINSLRHCPAIDTSLLDSFSYDSSCLREEYKRLWQLA